MESRRGAATLAAPDPPDRAYNCGYLNAAPFDVGGTYHDPAGIDLTVLGKTGTTYRVQLSRP
jgi:hypothetical protein